MKSASAHLCAEAFCSEFFLLILLLLGVVILVLILVVSVVTVVAGAILLVAGEVVLVVSVIHFYSPFGMICPKNASGSFIVCASAAQSFSFLLTKNFTDDKIILYINF